MSTVRLRGNAPRRSSPYPLGEIPHSVIFNIGRKVVHNLAVGVVNIAGNDFGDMFAAAIGGKHRSSPLGIADVEWEECAWSIKTIQASKPFQLSTARLISGRNSPVYSQRINDPFADLQQTGKAILEIWNERVNEAYEKYRDLRVVLLVRNVSKREFLLTEHEAHRYQPTDYVWELNRQRNLVGKEVSTGKHVFTWQPHGSQFTVLHSIPGSARKFKIVREPVVIDEQKVLDSIGFDESWIESI